MKKFRVVFIDGDYKEVECDRWILNSGYFDLIATMKDDDGSKTEMIVLTVPDRLVKYVEEIREVTDTERARKLIQKAKESQNGFVPEWEKLTQCKYRLYFDNECKEVRVMSSQLLNPDPTLGYWKDKSECEKFISENREDLIWFFTEYRR